MFVSHKILVQFFPSVAVCDTQSLQDEISRLRMSSKAVPGKIVGDWAVTDAEVWHLCACPLLLAKGFFLGGEGGPF